MRNFCPSITSTSTENSREITNKSDSCTIFQYNEYFLPGSAEAEFYRSVWNGYSNHYLYREKDLLFYQEQDLLPNVLILQTDFFAKHHATDFFIL